MSSSNCCFLTCIQISQELSQVVWYSHLFKNFPQFAVIHTVKGFDIVNKAEIDVFLELSCFFNNPMDVGNFISCSSAFSKTSLNIWNFMVHIPLKPAWRILSITLQECEMSAIVWQFEHSLALPFFAIGMKTDIFQPCGHWWVFQICWHIEYSTFIASSLRIWNSSTGIPSPPLALFMWCFLRPTWLPILGCLALGEWSYHCDYMVHEDLCCIVLLCILAIAS